MSSSSNYRHTTLSKGSPKSLDRNVQRRFACGLKHCDPCISGTSILLMPKTVRRGGKTYECSVNGDGARGGAMEP